MLLRFLLLVFGAAFPSLSCPPVRAEILEVQPAQLDLGRLGQEETLERTLLLHNRGQETLRLLGVDSDCTCTLVKNAPKELEPGASTQLHLRIETKALLGEVKRQVRVRSSAGELLIPVTFRVAPFLDWELSPLPLRFPKGTQGTALTLEGRMHFIGQGEGKVSEATTPVPWLKINVEPPTKDKDYRIQLFLTEAAPAGDWRCPLVLRVSGGREEVLSTWVTGYLSSRCRIVPATLLLAPVKPGEIARGELQVLDWPGTQAPELALRGGRIKALGRKGEAYCFSLEITAKETGTRTHKVQVYEGRQSLAEGRVVLRVLPTAEKVQEPKKSE